ncbi:hypothetical protein [Vibrio aestuarianus]|uniref:Uncharacterized protein n=1 Tax=Vibrio aestuarianus TaxID=28171 RepID=A0A9X4IQE7_9VIBR|nr:hypothetical protein [Vibrio aestuarianus]MDE1242967.1 hypothetical protein [Vibrio aestuarianus]
MFNFPKRVPVQKVFDSQNGNCDHQAILLYRNYQGLPVAVMIVPIVV